MTLSMDCSVLVQGEVVNWHNNAVGKELPQASTPVDQG